MPTDKDGAKLYIFKYTLRLATMPTDKDRAKLYIFKYTLRLQCLLTKTEPSFTSLNTPAGYNAY